MLSRSSADEFSLTQDQFHGSTIETHPLAARDVRLDRPGPGGDARYAADDAALGGHGELFRPVKQLCLLITRSTSRRVKDSLDQGLGRRTTGFVTPITSVPA